MRRAAMACWGARGVGWGRARYRSDCAGSALVCMVTNLRASASGANGRGRDEKMRLVVVGAKDAFAVSAAAGVLPPGQP